MDCTFQYDYATVPIKRPTLFLHMTNRGFTSDMFCPVSGMFANKTQAESLQELAYWTMSYFVVFGILRPDVNKTQLD